MVAFAWEYFPPPEIFPSKLTNEVTIIQNIFVVKADFVIKNILNATEASNLLLWYPSSVKYTHNGRIEETVSFIKYQNSIYSFKSSIF